MKTSSEKIPDSQVELSVELEAEEIEEYMAKAYKRLVNKVNIPGFRKGKVPRKMLEQYAGRGAFLEDIVNNDLSAIYTKAIDGQDIEAIDQPQIEISQIDPITFKATIPVRPTIELGDYKQIRMEIDTSEVTGEQVNGVIEQLRNAQAAWEPVDRETKWDDMLTVDVEASTEGQELGKEEARQYQLLPESQVPAPGFAEQLVAMKKGDGKSFTLSVPDEYGNQVFAGKEISFKVLVSEIKEKHLPDLNDDFAKIVGSESIDKLNESIEADLKTRAEYQAKAELEEKIVDAIVEQSQLEYPPILKEREIDSMVEMQRNQLLQAQVQLDDYLKHINKTEQDLRNDLEPSAEKKVKGALVLSKVAEADNIEVSDEEVEQELERMAPSDMQDKERFKEVFANPYNRASIMRTIRTKKTIQHLVDIATGNIDSSDKEESADAEKEVKDAAK
ncbi:trigger factor [Chloroflexota bacterium]